MAVDRYELSGIACDAAEGSGAKLPRADACNFLKKVHNLLNIVKCTVMSAHPVSPDLAFPGIGETMAPETSTSYKLLRGLGIGLMAAGVAVAGFGLLDNRIGKKYWEKDRPIESGFLSGHAKEVQAHRAIFFTPGILTGTKDIKLITELMEPALRDLAPVGYVSANTGVYSADERAKHMLQLAHEADLEEVILISESLSGAADIRTMDRLSREGVRVKRVTVGSPTHANDLFSSTRGMVKALDKLHHLNVALQQRGLAPVLLGPGARYPGELARGFSAYGLSKEAFRIARAGLSHKNRSDISNETLVGNAHYLSHVDVVEEYSNVSRDTASVHMASRHDTVVNQRVAAAHWREAVDGRPHDEIEIDAPHSEMIHYHQRYQQGLLASLSLLGVRPLRQRTMLAEVDMPPTITSVLPPDAA